jgi:flagellar motility protein MotE (MotC chaperone)
MLAAPWFLVVVALVVNVLTSALLLNSESSKIRERLAVKPGPSAEEVAAQEAAAAAAAAPPPVIWSFKTAAVDELIAELKNERQSLMEEQKDLAALSSQVTAERQEVERVKAEVAKMRQELDARVVEVAENERDNLKKLVQTYMVMPAPSAVLILRELDEDTVVKILSNMKADRVALILGEMARVVDKSSDEPPSRRAARISDKLRLMKALKKEVAQ